MWREWSPSSSRSRTNGSATWAPGRSSCASLPPPAAPAPPATTPRRPRRAGADVVPPPPPAGWTKPLPDAGVEWDVSAISQEEFASVRQFLERRWAIDPAARQRLAWQLAEGLRPKVAGVPPELHGEPLL